MRSLDRLGWQTWAQRPRKARASWSLSGLTRNDADGARRGLDEGLDRHAGEQLQTVEPGELAVGHANAHRVIGLAGRPASCVTSARDMDDLAVELGRRALVEGGEAQDGVLADMDLVDLLRRHLASTISESASGTISMIGSPAWTTPPTVWTLRWITLPSCGAPCRCASAGPRRRPGARRSPSVLAADLAPAPCRPRCGGPGRSAGS